MLKRNEPEEVSHVKEEVKRLEAARVAEAESMRQACNDR